jgi:uncharacterized membrane protein
MGLLETPVRALLAGLGLTLAILLVWMIFIGVDRIGLMSFLLRWLHVLAGIVWLGLIFFINFIQIVAIKESDQPGRAALLKSVVPRVAAGFRHASHLTLLTGVLLLVTTGYLLDRWMFTSAVYVPPLRNLLLWGGTLGGLVMWVLAHFVVWPNLKIVLGQVPGDDAAKAAARGRVETFARINLILSLPVTFVMVAASHLY